MRTGLIGCAANLVFLAGCQTEVASFEIDQFTDSRIPGVPEIPEDLPDDQEPPPLDELLGDMMDFQLDAQDLADRGVREEDISSLVVKTLTLTVLEGEDLGFLRRIEGWVLTDDHGNARLFDFDQFEDGATQVVIPVDGVNLRPYVFSESFAAQSYPDGDPPLVDTTIRATMRLEIGVTLQGVWNQLR